MKKLVLLIVLSVLVLVSCGSVPQVVNAQQENVIQAVLIAKSEEVEVYKFNDGERDCYITESSVNGGGMMSTGASIWCTP